MRDNVGTKIGVDSVVGLQSLAKPLQKKIASGAVHPHSIIRALNKLYKRPIPIPHKGEEVDDGEIIESPTNDIFESIDGEMEIPFEQHEQAEVEKVESTPTVKGQYDEGFQQQKSVSFDYTPR